jgi:hypothetical protein
MRLAICASLIAFMSVIAVGTPVLVYKAVEQSRPAQVDVLRRDAPPPAGNGTVNRDVSKGVTTAIAPPPIIAARPDANKPEAPQNEQHATTSSPPQTAASSREAVRENHASAQATPPGEPDAKARPVAKPAIKTTARAPVEKKTAHRARVKRRTNEALNTVRRFGDPLRDMPVDAYAADGIRRTIPIRPTSIQDVYYYSIPR